MKRECNHLAEMVSAGRDHLRIPYMVSDLKEHPVVMWSASSAKQHLNITKDEVYIRSS
jgi:hypothetical protein